ncbi:PH domain-containing protein [Liquorilactobacillus vini]|uniref:PH domain-containing protein n=1 Tax=Liquorilactobacillus vini TaxID=238015 RepID=UPI00030C54A9|nr:PH domain-containing protein [Liquorilactobacillus vini]
MAGKCSVCGNKIGIFTMTMNFKDGIVCSKCYKSVGMNARSYEIQWAHNTSYMVIKQFKRNHKLINVKAILEKAETIKNNTYKSKLAKIQRQFYNAGVSDLFGTKKEVKALPDILNDDEIVKYATSGFVEENTVLVVCTNQRILFIDKGMLYGIKSTEIPLDMVNGVSYSKGLVLGSISVVNGAKTTEIKNVNKETASLMANAIKKAAIEYKANLQENKSNSTSQIYDLANELRELKSLVNDGIITQEDFEAKKKQILNLK